MRISHAGGEVARHAERHGRRDRAVDAAHLHGIVARRPIAADDGPGDLLVSPGADLLRPLAEYERAAGGGW